MRLRFCLSGAVLLALVVSAAAQGVITKPPQSVGTSHSNGTSHPDAVGTSPPNTTTEKLLERTNKQTEYQQHLKSLFETEKQLSVSKNTSETLKGSLKNISQKLESIIDKRQETLEQQKTLTLEREALNIEKTLKRKDLEQKRQEASRLLGVLSRLSRNPPPALLLSNEDIVTGARVVRLTQSLLPRIEKEMVAHKIALSEYTRTELALFENALKLNTIQETLNEQQLALAHTLKEQEESLILLAKEQETLIEKTKSLTKSTKTLKQLITALEKEIYQALKAEQPRLKPSEETIQLIWPVRGKIKTNYGERLSPTVKSEGITIETEANAFVRAPCDGLVLYAGTYRTFGNIVIIDSQKGMTVVLMGLEKTLVQTGMVLARGEPLGQMGKAGDEKTEEPSPSLLPNNRQRLILEVRRGNQTQDPKAYLPKSPDLFTVGAN